MSMMSSAMKVRTGSLVLALAIASGYAASAQQAATVQISVRNHRFQPAEVRAPANRPLTLRIRNFDDASMEFESVSLRVEKVVTPKGEGLVNIRALSPGRYEFFDDFHQETRGVLVVQ